ncbi:MAG: ATP-dependent RecD-like DNA helicase [Rickettsiales bacterium]|nr:ATP-dependent RecD-like DNA helicase [Rickettsiales bacterium]
MNKKQQQFEYLSGTVERITYHNEENGFCVLKIKSKEQKDLITVTGIAPSLFVGEEIKIQGHWFNNLNYGLEFKANFIRFIPPNSLEGIQKYLGSGLIKGIGSHFAKKLVAAFGEKVFDVIENLPDRLSIVEGIGKVRAASICTNWSEQKVVREIMVFLQSHGVSISRATKIYKLYGEESIKIVSENPYRLVKDIRGIGFVSADKIAKNLGVEDNSLIRAKAGVSYILTEALNSGHCGLPTDVLIKNCEKLLSISKDTLVLALNEEIESGNIIKDYISTYETIFLAAFYAYEKNIAHKLRELSINQPLWYEIDSKKALLWVEDKLSISMDDSQKEAIRSVIVSKVTIITGGPGTGKTTILDAILKILRAKKFRIKLCAPTGRAAKRLSESTKLDAYTIHRLLKYDPSTYQFTYNHNNLLDCDCLVVDESSMIDVQLMYNLLNAIPEKSGLILVGDIDQLPSVGAGQVLKDLIDSHTIPTIKLSKIFRQSSNSSIISNAYLVNEGLFPKLENNAGDDFYFIEADSPELIIENILKLVSKTIPNHFKLNPITDIQILCSMQRGSCGTRSLNIELQKALNPLSSQGILKFGQMFSVNDKVMQIVNNYEKEVYNGDIGFITSIDQINQEIVAIFDKRLITYSFDELDELQIAYAITVHKSQGAEYPVVVIPMTTQHFPMLQKKLLYTAITRGKQLVFLVGQKKAISIAIQNMKESIRYSKLKQFLLDSFSINPKSFESVLKNSYID